MVHYHNLPWYGTIVYHGTVPQFTMVYQFQFTVVAPWYTVVYHGIPCILPWFTCFKIPWQTMVYHAFYHGKLWYTMGFTMVYQFQNTMVNYGIPWVLPWFTCFKIPWQTMVYHAFYHGKLWYTMVLPWFTSFKIPWYAMVYHGLYHGLPVSKYHGRPWYTMHFTMVIYGIPWVLPWFTCFKISWYTMIQFTMVQIHHGTIVPWYNVPWYTMVLFHKGSVSVHLIPQGSPQSEIEHGQMHHPELPRNSTQLDLERALSRCMPYPILFF